MKTLFEFYMEGDYAPVAVFTEDEILIEGDNVHNDGYGSYAEGYADGSGAYHVTHGIYSQADLMQYEELLKSVGLYDHFNNEDFL